MALSDSRGSPLDFSKFYNVIDGTLATTNRTRKTVNPITLENNPEAPFSTIDDVNQAVEAAQRATESWAEKAWDERARALRDFADALEAETEAFARVLAMEAGKPPFWARHEISTCVRYLRGFAELSLPDEVIEDTDDRKVVVRYTPLGVVAGIVPWNYPVQLACAKLAPAILTGNAFLWKPSPYTPYCSLKLAELGQRFFPPGVLQALSGDDALGPWLTAHPGIGMVTFTGSTVAGRAIMADCSRTLKRVNLELGGNDAAVVCADVDPVSVATKIGYVAFCHSGQICIAIKRVYVHEAIYDAVLASMVAFVKELELGMGETAFTGPVSTEAQYERLKDLLADVERRKLTVAAGSTKPVPDMKGYFFAPTVIDNPPDDARIVVEEQFGPVLPLLKWSDEDDVIKRANSTELGLGASVWSRDMTQAGRMARRLQAGNVWINTHAELQTNVPFSGYKQSGIGTDMGIDGLKSFCNVQSVYTRPAEGLPQY